MEFVTANDQCRTEVNIQGMALEGHVFKRWSLAAPHLCDVKCGQEIACQSYNYNRKYQICELTLDEKMDLLVFVKVCKCGANLGL